MDPIGAGLYILNIFLTSALLYLYLQNYSKMKSKYTIGLMTFAGFFLAQSALGLYFNASMVMYNTAGAETAAIVLEALKAIGFAVLLKISLE